MAGCKVNPCVPAPTEITIMVAELYKLQQRQKCTHAIMGVHFYMEGIRARKRMSSGTHRDHHHGGRAVQAAVETEMHACNDGCAISHGRDTSTQTNESRHPQRPPSWLRSCSSCSSNRNARMQ